MVKIKTHDTEMLKRINDKRRTGMKTNGAPRMVYVFLS